MDADRDRDLLLTQQALFYRISRNIVTKQTLCGIYGIKG